MQKCETDSKDFEFNLRKQIRGRKNILKHCTCLQVVARLRASCESLSEENLAKLAVDLFNCQAEIEGRRSFPCTQEMVIL